MTTKRVIAESRRLAKEERARRDIRLRLAGEAMETVLVNIAVSGTRAEINKARWIIARIEALDRFQDFKPLRGQLTRVFNEWRKGPGTGL